MKCISCETEINPKWSHAINKNECPYCGKEIMEEYLKNLLHSLNEIINSINTNNYKDQLDDWLENNYNYVALENLADKIHIEVEKLLKEKSFEFINFSNNNNNNKPIENVIDNNDTNIVSKSNSDDFFKRAEVSVKTDELKKKAQDIKNEGISGGTVSLYDEEDEDNYDYEDEEDAIPAAVLAMSKNNNTNNNPADLAKLQKLEQNRVNAVKKFKSGGGSFSR